MRGCYVMIVAALAAIVTGVSVKGPECPSSGIVMLPHPKEYNLYYICQDGKSTIHKYPNGQHVNDIIGKCTRPPVERFARMSPDISEEKAESNCIGTCPISYPKDKILRIYLPYRDNCNKFCSCSHGSPIVLSCPPGLHFHEAKQICNWPWLANCAVIEYK